MQIKDSDREQIKDAMMDRRALFAHHEIPWSTTEELRDVRDVEARCAVRALVADDHAGAARHARLSAAASDLIDAGWELP